MTIKMPKCFYGKCSECFVAAEYYFNEYGATESCAYCNAAPDKLIKVNLVNA